MFLPAGWQPTRPIAAWSPQTTKRPPEPKIRGRCTCGHWAFFHRTVELAGPLKLPIDPCRRCGCMYFEYGEANCPNAA
jgi:hypothetical protein